MEFIQNENRWIKEHFHSVWSKENAFAGGGIYAIRGGITKALMFIGYDSVFTEFKKCEIDDFSATVYSGLCSGALQGAITAIPEWVATKQASNGNKTIKENSKEIIEYLQNDSFTPIRSQIARNAVYDCIFFVLTRYFEIKFALAAPIAMTSSYHFEKIRSLSQQGKTTSEINKIFKNQSQKDKYTGWFAKAIEFTIVYALLDYFRKKNKQFKEKTNSYQK